MNTEQIKDMHLLYNAVYNEELREQFDEYNNTIYDEDIVEVATEYFYSYGLNEDGIGILIEKVGLESFVEYVYDLSEDLHVLTEARARKKYSGPSYDEVKAGIDAREAKARAKKEAKKKASEAASEKKETERAEPESRGVESQAKAEQPKSKKPERSGIARAISGAVDRAKRDTALLQKSWNTAREVGRGHEANVAKAAGTVVGAAHGAAKVAHRLGQEAGKSETGKKIKKVLFGEEVEAWVNQLVEEGYDLSDYTWEEMVEIYEQNINYDMFDVILEYLVAEGYADTNESALVIMANMSEDWRESIVEGGFNSSGRYDVGGGRTVGPVAGAVRSLFSGNLPKGQTYVPPSPQKGTNRPPAVPSSKGDSGKLTDFGAGGGKAKLKTGMSVGQVERQGRMNKGDYSG